MKVGQGIGLTCDYWWMIANSYMLVNGSLINSMVWRINRWGV